VKATFARWKSPWFYLPDEAAYQSLFSSAGLKMVSCQVVLEEYDYSVASIDLPGHGCSEGRRIFVRDFDDYLNDQRCLLVDAQEKAPD
jgi:hypothetical protein